jgi:hypothetical protein
MQLFNLSVKGKQHVMQLNMQGQQHVLDPTCPPYTMYMWSQGMVEQLANELLAYPHVRRMSYDTWHWRNRQELDAFVTYWHLAHD